MKFNNLNSIEILKKLDQIKVFMFDLEGVLINDFEDVESVCSQLKEFCAALAKANLLVGIITAREWDIITARLNEINNCFVITSSVSKEKMMDKKLNELGMGFHNLFYIGDDILDLPLLQKSEISCAPKNAKREVKRAVNIVLDEDESLNLLDTILQLRNEAVLTK